MNNGIFLPKRKVNKRTIWLITFGDLLTLLLCFFLSTVALPLRATKHQAPEIVKDMSPTDIKQVQPLVDPPSGTLLATYHDESLDGLKEMPSREYAIREAFFAPGTKTLSEEGVRNLKSTPLSTGYELESAEIQFCADEKRYSGVRGRRLSTGRVLSVRSQLIDTGIPAEVVRIRAGYECGYESTKRTADIAGTIRFSVRKSENG